MISSLGFLLVLSCPAIPTHTFSVPVLVYLLQDTCCIFRQDNKPGPMTLTESMDMKTSSIKPAAIVTCKKERCY